MKILIDGDACPVKEEMISLAEKYQLHIMIYIDVSHILEDEYAEIIYCDIGKDSVDFKILKDCEKGDLLITQDYELASFALSKEVYCFNFFGIKYTHKTMDELLFSRYISMKARRHGIRQTQKARNIADNHTFFKNIDAFLYETLYNIKK